MELFLKTNHQQHQSQYPRTTAQHLPILPSPNQQNSVLKRELHTLKGATKIKPTNSKKVNKKSLQNKSRKWFFVNCPGCKVL